MRVRAHRTRLDLVVGTTQQPARRGRRRAFAFVSVLSIALAVVAISAVSASAGGGNADNVTICHRSNAVGNEYQYGRRIYGGRERASPTSSSVNTRAPPVTSAAIFPSTAGIPRIMWGDIIPAVNLPPNSFNGLNYAAEGLAILANDCAIRRRRRPRRRRPRRRRPRRRRPRRRRPRRRRPRRRRRSWCLPGARCSGCSRVRRVRRPP